MSATGNPSNEHDNDARCASSKDCTSAEAICDGISIDVDGFAACSGSLLPLSGCPQDDVGVGRSEANDGKRDSIEEAVQREEGEDSDDRGEVVEESAASAKDSASDVKMSKNKQKRLAKQARLQKHWEERKQKEKEEREAKKLQRLHEWEELTEEEQAAKRQKRIDAIVAQKQSQTEQKQRFLEALASGPRVVIDVNFYDKMGEREFRSVAQQIMFSYSILKKSSHPIQMSVCGLQPNSNLAEMLSKTGSAQWPIKIKANPFYEEHPDRSKVVYLTADSENVLETLDHERVYVIGGIVDHNKYQGLTLQLAKEHGVSHARLPLQEFLDLSHAKFTKVLTIDHMVAVLCFYNETHDWATAFLKGIPQRKQIQPNATPLTSTNDAVLTTSGSDEQGV